MWIGVMYEQCQGGGTDVGRLKVLDLFSGIGGT